MPTGPRKARPDDRLRIEPGISRFRAWSFGPSRNDEGWIARNDEKIPSPAQLFFSPDISGPNNSQLSPLKRII